MILKGFFYLNNNIVLLNAPSLLLYLYTIVHYCILLYTVVYYCILLYTIVYYQGPQVYKPLVLLYTVELCIKLDRQIFGVTVNNVVFVIANAHCVGFLENRNFMRNRLTP